MFCQITSLISPMFVFYVCFFDIVSFVTRYLSNSASPRCDKYLTGTSKSRAHTVRMYKKKNWQVLISEHFWLISEHFTVLAYMSQPLKSAIIIYIRYIMAIKQWWATCSVLFDSFVFCSFFFVWFGCFNFEWTNICH